MSDITPEQVAALKELRRKRFQEAQQTLPKLLTRAEIESMLRARERANEPSATEIGQRSSLWIFLGNLFRVPSFQVVSIGAAIALVIISAILMAPDQQRPIQLVALVENRNTPALLPENLTLDFESGRAILLEGEDSLSGPLKLLDAESDDDVTAFSVTLIGQDSAGVEGRFQGTIWVTNRSAITGARLIGTFEISGQITNAVDQSFIP